jgi:hypothetical protein
MQGRPLNRRSFTYKWTQEDRLTRSYWIRGIVIFYGCIVLVLVAVIASIKPSHVAQNGLTYRSVEHAVSQRAQHGTVDCTGKHHQSCVEMLIGD